MNIRASGISRQRREAVDSPQNRYIPRSYGAQSARFNLHPGQPSAPAQMQSAPLPAAMMTDENARCNAAMDGAGPAHRDSHDDAECRPIERKPRPSSRDVTRTRRLSVTCDLVQDPNPVECGGL
jgi:hypothetical protein